MNRTSLLAWSLMKLSQVEVADLVGGGWIEIRVETHADFDELTFKLQIAGVLAEVRDLPAYRSNTPWRQGVCKLAAARIDTSTPRPVLPPS
jgi:hypothetical protein